jgi:acyl-homoserine lactone acylase PvdQ
MKLVPSLVLIVLSVGICAGAQPADSRKLTIYRDHSGVPHVFADTPEALYFGGGYALTQDRMAEFDRARRAARGRMAEIDPSLLEADKQARQAAYSSAEIQAMFDSLAPQHQRMLEAHVAGMNRAIDEAIADPQNKMPYEFGVLWKVTPERWTVHDYIATYAAHRRSLSSGGGRELVNLAFHQYLVARHGRKAARRIFDDVLPLGDPDAIPTIASNGASPRNLAKIPPPAKLGQAAIEASRALLAAMSSSGQRSESRSVVIGSRRSANGHVLMLQATSDGPQIHYSGAGFEAYGYTRQGGGPLIQGRGPTFGWLQSIGWDDMIDTFAEKLNPANKYQYWFKGKWREMARHTETLLVRGGPAVTLEIAKTIHGPVVAWDLERQTAYTQQHALEGLEMRDWACNLEFTRARSLAGFEQSVQLCAASSNIQYGDEDGHIAHWHVARQPIRARGTDPRLPVPGTGEYEWQGFTTFSDYPKVLDPPEGYLHVWNNKATADTSYRDAHRWGATFRNYLAHDLVRNKRSITMDDMREINRKLGVSWGGTDSTLTSPKFFAPYLQSAVAGDPRLERVVAALANWNGLFEDLDQDGRYDEPGLTIFLKWLQLAREMILVDDIGDWEPRTIAIYRTAILHRAVQGKDAGLPMRYDWFNGQDRNAVLRRTVARTAEELTKEFASADPSAWRTPIFWKYYDPAAIATQPDKKPYSPDPWVGVVVDEFSGWQGSTAASLGLIPRAVPANGSERWNGLMEISRDTKDILDVTPVGGQNQFINLAGKGNPHLADQLMLHVNFQFKKVPLTRKAIEQEAESVTVLELPP